MSALFKKKSKSSGDSVKSVLQVHIGSGLKRKWRTYTASIDDRTLTLYEKRKTRPKEKILLAAAILKSGDGLSGEENTIALIGPRPNPIFLKTTGANAAKEKSRWMVALAKVCASTEWSSSSMSAGFVDPVVVADYLGTIVEVNDPFCDLFGYTRNKIMGKNVSILCPPTIQKAHAGFINRFVTTGEKRLIGQKRSITGVHADGSEVPINISLGAEGEGENVTFIALMRSDAGRKLTEASQAEINGLIEGAIEETLNDAKLTLKTAMDGHLKKILEQLSEAKATKKLMSAKKNAAEFYVELDESDLNTSASEQDTTSMSMLEIDTERVQMGRKLGGGGSGAVVYACKVDGWECAVKELTLGSNIKQSVLDNTLSELVLLESLPKHKNLVQFLFHQKRTDCIRIFMSRYEMTLTQYMKTRYAEQDYFSASEVVKMIFDLVRALEVLHDFNVMHRDIKSGNVFVNLDQLDKVSHVTLSDFDSAKVVAAGTTQQARTITGTIGWMPPEVYKGGASGYTFSADVWSLGATFFEMMDLGFPYANIDDFERPAFVGSGAMPEFRNPLKANALYKDIIPIWKKMMALNPDDRPNLKEIRTMLAEHL